jgi:hypothetical protein
MDILESLGIPIVPYSPPSKDIEIYENDYSKINIFYYVTQSQENFFLLEIKKEKLQQENLMKNLIDLILNPNKGILRPLKVLLKNEISFFIQYEFSDITLSKFILNSEPSLETRLDLLKQFVKILIHFHNNNIELDHVDGNYIFVENLESPVLKIFYNGNFKKSYLLKIPIFKYLIFFKNLIF